MIHEFKDTEHVYIRSMGRLLRVTAVATGADEANAYMADHENQGLLAECGEFCFMADVNDKGTKISNLKEHDV